MFVLKKLLMGYILYRYSDNIKGSFEWLRYYILNWLVMKEYSKNFSGV